MALGRHLLTRVSIALLLLVGLVACDHEDKDGVVDAALAPEMELSQTQGPSGTDVIVVLVGMEPARDLVLFGGAQPVEVTTDEGGVLSVTITVSGEPGPVPIEVATPEHSDILLSETFEITAPPPMEEEEDEPTEPEGEGEEVAVNPAAGITLGDTQAQQDHDTAQLPAELILANALSAIRLTLPSPSLDGWHAFAILDADQSGTVSAGDAAWIQPQPIENGMVALGIDQGGHYFVAVAEPDILSSAGLFGSPLAGPREGESGEWMLAEGQSGRVFIIPRGPDDPAPGFFNVDFGDPDLVPRP